MRSLSDNIAALAGSLLPYLENEIVSKLIDSHAKFQNNMFTVKVDGREFRRASGGGV